MNHCRDSALNIIPDVEKWRESVKSKQDEDPPPFPACKEGNKPMPSCPNWVTTAEALSPRPWNTNWLVLKWQKRSLCSQMQLWDAFTGTYTCGWCLGYALWRLTRASTLSSSSPTVDASFFLTFLSWRPKLPQDKLCGAELCPLEQLTNRPSQLPTASFICSIFLQTLPVCCYCILIKSDLTVEFWQIVEWIPLVLSVCLYRI